jgi:carbonic anhydrase
MHTVHYPRVADPTNGYIAAAVGIMFSVNDYNAKLTWAEEKIIDNFFENINMDTVGDKASATPVDWVLYADLLSLVNTDNRWVYRGSVTTPPCAQNVYWNVMTTVYPIKEKYVT